MKNEKTHFFLMFHFFLLKNFFLSTTPSFPEKNQYNSPLPKKTTTMSENKVPDTIQDFLAMEPHLSYEDLEKLVDRLSETKKKIVQSFPSSERVQKIQQVKRMIVNNTFLSFLRSRVDTLIAVDEEPKSIKRKPEDSNLFYFGMYASQECEQFKEATELLNIMKLKWCAENLQKIENNGSEIDFSRLYVILEK